MCAGIAVSLDVSSQNKRKLTHGTHCAKRAVCLCKIVIGAIGHTCTVSLGAAEHSKTTLIIVGKYINYNKIGNYILRITKKRASGKIFFKKICVRGCFLRIAVI